MPPNLPAPNNDNGQSVVVKSGGNTLAGFYNLSSLEHAIQSTDWSLAEEFDILTDIARNDPKGSTRVSAINSIKSTRREILEIAGVLVKGDARRVTPNSDGSHTVESVSTYKYIEPAGIDDGDTPDFFAYHSKPGEITGPADSTDSPQSSSGVDGDVGGPLGVVGTGSGPGDGVREPVSDGEHSELSRGVSEDVADVSKFERDPSELEDDRSD